MQVNGYYESPYGDYWGGYGAQQTFQGYPCEACGGYGHETHACPNVEWKYENGMWQSRLLPSQGSYYANDSFYAGEEPEGTYDPYEANLNHTPSAHTDDYHIQQQYYEYEDMVLTSMENKAEACRNGIADIKTMMEQMMVA
jgi:hypothetical protein